MPKPNGPSYINQVFVLGSGLKGFWLSSSSHVDLQGVMEARTLCNGCFEYRNVDVAGQWHDDVDANSFPGISYLSGETKDVFDNEAPWFVAIIEGLWDIIGDKIADTDFGVTVTFQDRSKQTLQVCCDK